MIRSLVCRGQLDPHHIQRRSQGGRDIPENLIVLCRAHHDWVHEHPLLAEEFGLLRRSGPGCVLLCC